MVKANGQSLSLLSLGVSYLIYILSDIDADTLGCTPGWSCDDLPTRHDAAELPNACYSVCRKRQ